jgi:hypothetical protein
VRYVKLLRLLLMGPRVPADEFPSTAGRPPIKMR